MRPPQPGPGKKDDLQRVGRSQAGACVILEGPSAASGIKTTAQKIEDFYGVKQIGQNVFFAAHFDNAHQVMIAAGIQQLDAVGHADAEHQARRMADAGAYSAGRYRYRLVVDDHWITDPNNQYVEANQFGELNNVVEVD